MSKMRKLINHRWILQSFCFCEVDLLPAYCMRTMLLVKPESIKPPNITPFPYLMTVFDTHVKDKLIWLCLQSVGGVCFGKALLLEFLEGFLDCATSNWGIWIRGICSCSVHIHLFFLCGVLLPRGVRGIVLEQVICIQEDVLLCFEELKAQILALVFLCISSFPRVNFSKEGALGHLFLCWPGVLCVANQMFGLW